MHSPARSHDTLLSAGGQRQNRLLADDYLSYTATRDHHWNITDAESRRLHQQFQAQFEKADDTPDPS